MTNFPSPLEMAVRWSPVSSLVTVIVAPGSTAFPESMTVPVISDRPP